MATERYDIEDLGDGGKLLFVPPVDGSGGFSIELLPDGGAVFNMMSAQGRSLRTGMFNAMEPPCTPSDCS